MKILLVVCVLAVLLTGCGAEPVWETVADEWQVPVMAQAQKIWLQLPENAAMETFGGQDGSQLYVCGDMTVCVQTLAGGDLDRTLRQTTGFGKEAVSLMQWGNTYECAWIAAGETELQVGRTRILEEGDYHYAVSVSVPETQAGQLQGQVRQVLDSMMLVDPDFRINTGS